MTQPHKTFAGTFLCSFTCQTGGHIVSISATCVSVCSQIHLPPFPVLYCKDYISEPPVLSGLSLCLANGQHEQKTGSGRRGQASVFIFLSPNPTSADVFSNRFWSSLSKSHHESMPSRWLQLPGPGKPPPFLLSLYLPPLRHLE